MKIPFNLSPLATRKLFTASHRRKTSTPQIGFIVKRPSPYQRSPLPPRLHQLPSAERLYIDTPPYSTSSEAPLRKHLFGSTSSEAPAFGNQRRTSNFRPSSSSKRFTFSSKERLKLANHSWTSMGSCSFSKTVTAKVSDYVSGGNRFNLKNFSCVFDKCS